MDDEGAAERPAFAPGSRIDYASRLPPDSTARTLRRLVILNAVIGPLIVVQWPVLFVVAFLLGWYTQPGRVRTPMLADFQRVLAPQQAHLLPTLLWSVAFGLMAIATSVCVSRRRWRVLTIAAAFWTCMAFPFGTTAGLPTAIILMRRSTAAAYKNRPASV